jgi:GNAT superfamily N-acetyltransferase
MKRDANNFNILSGYESTAPFVEEVRAAADANRNSLGFLPKSVYVEFAQRDDLYLLVERQDKGLRYAGHLLFERRFPRAHVVQTFVLPEYRRYGLASVLIDHLRTSLTNEGFISIWARVADDLVDANRFWERKQFYVQRVEQGGASRKREILVRCHELPSPQLFPPSGISSTNPLGLRILSSNVVPMFLLDLNVLFDLAPRRLRHNDAVSLFQAERMNYCRLAISDEIREELRRTAQKGKTDPMEAYISIFPSFPVLRGDDTAALRSELALLIFPEKGLNALSANDVSDLSHVATAIEHDLAGLITSDTSILSAGPSIRAKYGIEILSPAAFTLDDAAQMAANDFQISEQATLTLLDLSPSHEHEVRTFLSRLKLSGSALRSGWLPRHEQMRIARRCGVWNGQNLLGYLTWSARDPAGVTTARIAVDETDPQALAGARVLLVYLLEQLAADGPRHINLELVAHQSDVRDVAVNFGFRTTADGHNLAKLILGRVLTRETWSKYQAELSNKGGPKLPATIPAYRGADQYVQVLTPDGNRTHVTLEDLESLLSPTLFCLPGRPAVITPVQKSFADPLLGHSPQGSLLPHGTASLFQDRHYLSDPRTLRHFKHGNLILFYESTRQRGSGELIAIARVREAYLKPADALDQSDLVKSVLTTTHLHRIGNSAIKTVTVFDNIFPLPRRVPLESLKRIGCGRPTDLITTRPINDQQLQQILAEAFSNGK